MNIYQQQILEHYHHPQNSGKPANYTHTLKLENLSCGDEITIYLTIENNTIADIHYEASGCAISVASASMLSEDLKGKNLEEVNKLSVEDVLKLLGIELTTSRLKCADLPLQAIQKAAVSEFTPAA